MTHSDPPPVSLSEAIENERIELMQIQAMLKCLYEVLLYADDDDSVMHADVANVCARLISDCVARLDAVRLLTLRTTTPTDDDPMPPPRQGVQESHPTYLC
jgi:hypothetical protein